MDRRVLLTALACCVAPTGARAAQGRPRHRISAGTLHEALSQRFPLRLDLGGLFELVVGAPALLLLPARNKLGASLQAQAGGAIVQQLPPGELDLVFSLRYERRDRTLRAHDPELLDLRWQGLPPQAVQAFRRVLPAVAQEAMGEIELHHFSDRDLALADAMGFEPERITVMDDGILLEFGPKPRR